MKRGPEPRRCGSSPIDNPINGLKRVNQGFYDGAEVDVNAPDLMVMTMRLLPSIGLLRSRKEAR